MYHNEYKVLLKLKNGITQKSRLIGIIINRGLYYRDI